MGKRNHLKIINLEHPYENFYDKNISLALGIYDS